MLNIEASKPSDGTRTTLSADALLAASLHEPPPLADDPAAKLLGLKGDTSFTGERYRGFPLPLDLNRWTESKQDAVYRYIDFIWELKGVSRRQIINGPDKH